MTDMTKGKPLPLIFRFSLPLMASGLLQQFYTITDTIIVGRGVGIQALAALGASDWINWFFLWGVQGLTQGFSIPIALAVGAADRKSLRHTAAMIVRLCTVLGVVLTVVGLICITPLLRLLRTEPAIMSGAQLYLRVLFAGMIVVLAYNMAAAILRCMGDSKSPLVAILIAACVNIGLDLLFIMVFHWGIFGAAFATVIAQGISFLFCLWRLHHVPDLKLEADDWKTDWPLLCQLSKLGFPVSLQNAVIAIGGMVVQFVLNGYGFLFVAGFTATNKLLGILESTAIAFGYAMTTYMGQNRGARNTKRIDAGMRSILLLSAVFSVLLGAASMIWGHEALALFVSAEEANAAQVVDIAFHYLSLMSVMLWSLYLLYAFRASLQGLGNTTIPMLSGVMEFVMRVLVALILPRLIGQEGIFFSEVSAWAGAALLLVVYYFSHIHKIKQHILLDPVVKNDRIGTSL